MQQNTGHHTAKGLPELNLLVYAVVALLAYVLLQAV